MSAEQQNADPLLATAEDVSIQADAKENAEVERVHRRKHFVPLGESFMLSVSLSGRI